MNKKILKSISAIVIAIAVIGIVVKLKNGQNKSVIYDIQTYSSFPKTIKLQGQDIKLSDSVYFSVPKIFVADTLCCIYDMAVKEGCCCHIFKYPEFKYKYSLVKVGRGKDEIINLPSSIEFQEGYIDILDNINKKILRYNVLDTTITPIPIYSLKDYILDFVPLSDTSFAAISTSPQHTHRIKIYNQSGNIIDTLLPLPKLKKAMPTDFDINEVWASHLWYDAKDTLLIVATQHGEVLDFINLQTKRHRTAVGAGGKPELDYKGNTITIPGKIIGFNGISADDQYIYTLFSGISQKDFIWENAEENYKLQIYDKQGKPVCQYIFDRPVTSCYVDMKHRKIYTTDRISEWMLSVFDL